MSAPSAQLYEFIRLVRPVFRALYDAVEAGLVGSGITVSQRAVLETLHDLGPATVPRIAEALALDRQPVQRAVDELLASGLVARAENPAHRRSWLVVTTEAGRRAFASVREREDVVIAQVGDRLDAADVEAAIRVARAVVAGFSR